MSAVLPERFAFAFVAVLSAAEFPEQIVIQRLFGFHNVKSAGNAVTDLASVKGGLFLNIGDIAG